VIVIIRKINW